MTGVTIAGIFIFIVIAYFIGTYNKFVKLKNRATEAWSDVEIQLKRRYNLIPNLVETVKGYAKHEMSTLEKVIQARNGAMSTGSDPEDLASLKEKENIITGTLKSLFAVTENYPDLKANANFLHLQTELVDIENKIKASMRFYNSNVRANNITVEQFPSNLIAGMFSFKCFDYFELDETEKEAVKNVPKISF